MSSDVDPVELTERLAAVCYANAVKHARVKFPDGFEIDVELAVVKNPGAPQADAHPPLAPPPGPPKVSADVMDAFGAAAPVLNRRR